MKDDAYYLHQTPNELAKDLINQLDICQDDVLYEPFKGEGAFYNNFPVHSTKYYTEIEEGLDYKDFNTGIDWVITNPPFQLDHDARINSFWFLLNYYSDKASKGIAFLGNDNCLSALTPKRLELLKIKGWYLNKMIVCSVKKWRGRYFFFVFTKNNNGCYSHLLKNYS
jgi:hypothetical protein